MPICTICGKIFPNHEIIEGKYKNISKRKTCLDCVPFGSVRLNKERKPSGLFCIKCGKFLSGNQRKYCSRNCQTSSHMMRHSREKKRKAVEYKGGKCQKCGYNKCLGALEFHHLIPDEKEYNLDQQKLARWGWEKLKKELDKCILLCSNCHKEEHWKEERFKHYEEN